MVPRPVRRRPGPTGATGEGGVRRVAYVTTIHSPDGSNQSIRPDLQPSVRITGEQRRWPGSDGAGMDGEEVPGTGLRHRPAGSVNVNGSLTVHGPIQYVGRSVCHHQPSSHTHGTPYDKNPLYDVQLNFGWRLTFLRATLACKLFKSAYTEGCHKRSVCVSQADGE